MDKPSVATVARNALWNVVPLGWSLLIALGTTSYFIREVGLTHFGVYGLAMVLTAPLGLAGLGFSTAAIKYVSEYRAIGDMREARRVLETVYWMAWVVGGIGAALLAVAGPSLGALIFRVAPQDLPILRDCILLTAGLWLFQQPAAALAAIPAGMSQYAYVAVGNLSTQTITAILQVLLVAEGYGVRGLMAGAVAGAAVAWGLWFVLARHVTQATPSRPRLHRDIWFACFRFGGWQTLAQLGSLLATYAERTILGMVLAPSAVGIYNAVLRLEQSAMAAAYRVGEVLLPWFSSRSSGRPSAAGVREMLRAGWVAGTATTAMLAPLITLAPDILSVWLGQQVAKQGAAVLAVMTIGGMLGASTNTVQVFLLANARTGWIALLSLAYGILTCGLAAILVPRFGLSAAAVAGSAALLVRPPAIHWMLRTLGESSVPIGRQIHSLYIPVIVGVGVAVAARAVLPQLQTWVALATGYVITAASVGATVIAVGMLTPGASERRADVLRLIMALRGERRR